MAITPNYPMVNLGNLYIQGGSLTYVTTTTFTVGIGQFRDSTNINDIVLASAATVSLAKTGIGGLDTGTLAASTIYYVYAIGSSVYGANNGLDAGASQGVGPTPGVTTTVPAGTTPNSYVPAGVIISATNGTPTLPFGYDMFRRIGAIRTTAGSLIEPFVQRGLGKNRPMRYMTPVSTTATAGTVTYATIGALLAIVPQIQCDVIIACTLTAATAGNSLYLGPYGNTAAGYCARFSAPIVSAAVAYIQLVSPCALNAAATPVVEVDYFTTAAGDVVAFAISGYVDAL